MRDGNFCVSDLYCLTCFNICVTSYQYLLCSLRFGLILGRGLIAAAAADDDTSGSCSESSSSSWRV